MSELLRSLLDEIRLAASSSCRLALLANSYLLQTSQPDSEVCQILRCPRSAPSQFWQRSEVCAAPRPTVRGSTFQAPADEKFDAECAIHSSDHLYQVYLRQPRTNRFARSGQPRYRTQLQTAQISSRGNDFLEQAFPVVE